MLTSRSHPPRFSFRPLDRYNRLRPGPCDGTPKRNAVLAGKGFAVIMGTTKGAGWLSWWWNRRDTKPDAPAGDDLLDALTAAIPLVLLESTAGESRVTSGQPASLFDDPDPGLPAVSGNWDTLVFPADRAWRDEMLAAWRSGERRGDPVHYRITLGEDSARWVEERLVRSTGGVLVSAVCDHTPHVRIEEERRYLGHVLDRMQESVITTNLEGVVTGWNEGARRLHGYTAEEMIGRDISELYPVGDRDRVHAEVIPALLRDEALHFEVCTRNKLGKEVVQEVFLDVLRSDDGRPVALIGYGSELTALRETEQQLQAALHRYRSLFEKTPLGIILVNLLGDIEDINSAFERITGYSIDEIRGLNIQEITHPDDRFIDVKLAESLIAGEMDTYVIEKRYIHKDGHHVPVRLVTAIIPADGENPPLALGIVEDITAQKQADITLRESEHRFRQVMERAPDGMFILNEDGEIFDLNRCGCAQLGGTREALLGRRYQGFLPDLTEEELAPMGQRLIAGEELALQTSFLSLDGRKFPVEMSAARLDLGGDPSVLVITRDVSGREAAKQALRASEALYRALVENQTEFICRFLPDGRMVFANDALCRHLGVTQATLQAHRFLACIHEDDREGLRQKIENLEPVHMQSVRIPDKDGALCWVSLNCAPLFNNRGQLTEYQAVGRDVTEHRRADDALYRRACTEALVAEISAMLLNAAPNGREEALLAVLGRLGSFLHLDRCYLLRFRENAAILDCTHEWCAHGVMTRKSVRQGLDPRDRQWLQSRALGLDTFAFDDAMDLPEDAAGDQPFLREQNIRVLMGAPMIYRQHALGFIGADMASQPRAWSEEDCGLLRISADLLTSYLERDRGEAALRFSEARFRSVFADSALGIVLLDPDGRVTEANDPAGRLFGVEPYLLTGMMLPELAAPESRESLRALVRVVASGAMAAVSGEERLMGLGAARVWVRLSLSMIRDDAGHPRFIAVMIEDIRARVVAEEQLKAYTARLEAANHELAQYASVVSHDLKTPLRAIHNYADFLRIDLEGTLPGEQEHFLKSLGRAVRDAETMVDDLLQLTRIGRRHPDPEPVNLGEVAAELAETLRAAENAEVSVMGNAPVIVTERALVRQILQNLMSNAVKFNDSDPRRVEIGWTNPGHDRVGVYVKDNGIGIDPKYHGRIYNVFERLHDRNEYEGTGMGLAVVRKAVAHLGGEISLESATGAGSVFTVTLPKEPGARPGDDRAALPL
jgi:PAS domain S-box-containing protein